MDLSRQDTFEAAYSQHARGAYAAAYRILSNAAQAQDVVQDVFLRLWRTPDRFDSKRGELGSYLRLMARSRALDMWREGQAAGRASDRLVRVVGQQDARVEEQPELAALRQDDRTRVRAALYQLPPHQREAVTLAYWGGLTAAQIASESNVPIGTAKSRIRLGLARLRETCGADLRLAA